MKTSTMVMIGAGVIALTYFSTKTKSQSLTGEITQTVGQATGQAVAETIINTPVGFIRGLWDVGYNFGQDLRTRYDYNVRHYGNPLGLGWFIQ